MSSALTANPLLSSYLFDWHCIKDTLLNLGRDDLSRSAELTAEAQSSANSTSKPFSRLTNGCVGHSVVSVRQSSRQVSAERTRIPTLFRIANAVLTELQLEKHPDKTFIGKLSRGFDTLGYQFNEQGIAGPSKTTIQRSVKRTTPFSLMTMVGTTVPSRPSYDFKMNLKFHFAPADASEMHPYPKHFLTTSFGSKSEDI